MAEPIKRLRLLTNAGTADFSPNGVSYWTDDQLQAELDRTQLYITQVELLPVPIMVTGSFQYKDYLIPDIIGLDLERVASDSPWSVKDSAGATIGTALYTVNYDSRRLTFTTDQQNQPRYLDVCSYNLNLASAQVWEEKASLVARRIDWKTDGHDIKASQEIDHCLKMAKRFRIKAGAGASVGKFVRTDENPVHSQRLWGEDVQLSNFRPSRTPGT